MRHIRRAAVTGLFAIWLAPLSATVEAGRSAGASFDSADGRHGRIESPLLRQERTPRAPQARREEEEA